MTPGLPKVPQGTPDFGTLVNLLLVQHHIQTNILT